MYLKKILNILVVAFIYYSVARVGLSFSFENTNATPIWPPSGFAFAAVLFLGYRIWPGIFLGAFFANFISLYQQGLISPLPIILVSVFVAIGNTLEAVFGFFLINKIRSSKDPFTQAQEVFKFAIVTLIMCVTSATIGSMSITLGGMAPWIVFKNVWFTWWLGDVSGILLFTPMFLAWKRRITINKNFWWWFETLVLVILIMAACYMIFESQTSTLESSQAYLLIPLLLWVVFRLGEQMAMTMGVVVSVMAIWGTVHGKGPFYTQNLNNALLSLQGFICVMSVTMMAVAANIHLKKEADNRLRESNEWLEKKVQSRTLVLEQKTQELIHTNAELEQINRVTVDREERIIELKQHINQLSLNTDKAPPYNLTYLTGKELPQNPDTVEPREKDPAKRRLIMQSLLEDLYEANSKSLARLAAIVESSDDAIVGQSLDGSITTWNYGAERIYGYKAEEIIGSPASALTAPEYVDQMLKLTDEVRLGKSIQHYETVCLQKNGKLIDVSLTISPVRDSKGKIAGVSVIARDITKPKRAEETFRRVVESVPNGIVIVNSKGEIVLVNLQTEKMFGYSRQELLGKPVEVLMPKQFRGVHPNYRKGFMANPSARRMGVGRDLVAQHKDGHEIPVEIGLSPIETDEGIHVLSSIIDITERKRLDKLKDSFLSTVSHELRTPLAILKIGVDNLEAGRFWSLNDEEKEMAETLKRSADRLEKLINDLLDLSRLESDQTKKNVQNVDMGLLIDEVLKGEQILAGEQNIVIKKDVEKDIPMVSVDPDLLVRVLANLLNNALRFARSQIIISLHKIDQQLQVSVCDDGDGIKPEHIASLFNKFVQINRPIGGAGYKGTGLGLAICREIIELHQGKIWAESTIGEGSKFHFMIPLDKA